MASSRINYRQDLPPKEGYASFNVDRVKAPLFLSGRKSLWLLPLIPIAGSYLIYEFNQKRLMRNRIEMRSAKHAILPILVAERDRQVLKQIRYNREEEADLMKDYPDWEVGTFFGEPIYKTFGEDEFIEPSFIEYFAHVIDKTFYRVAGELFS